MPFDVHIDKARPEDAVAISGLFRTLGPFFTACEDGTGAQDFFASVSEASIARYIASPGYDYRVAVCGEQLAGAVSLRDRGHLYHLIIAPPFQGQGLGRKLWTIVRDAAIVAGNDGVFTVNSSLYGVPVYQRFGFVRCGEPTVQHGVVFVPMRLAMQRHAEHDDEETH